jgi:hypothetical protein
MSVRNWLRISLFNLLLVACLGVVMRYKIAYSLPFIDQRNLLHAHSHFAFAGWITQALMSLLVGYLAEKGKTNAFRKYTPVLLANLVTAYGMLFTFPFMGYKFLSILFSTLSIFVSYWFAVQYWIDLDKLKLKSSSHACFKAAIVFNAVSSAGAFSLAYMLATKHIQPNSYLASIYFFLHFQYNGWFFFACLGLLFSQVVSSGIPEKALRKIFMLSFAACVPAYLLSALWLPVPALIYFIVVLAVLCQLAGWVWLVKLLLKIPKNIIPSFARGIFIFCAVAFSIKLCLQAGSVIPALSKLAFGFRPIVIGYLHLVLLGVMSLFIFAWIIAKNLIHVNRWMRYGTIIFISGIIINETLLMIQGVADLSYRPVNGINLLLFIAALMLCTGMIVINYSQKSDKYDSTHKMNIS